jgi:hypothetical protein
MKTGFAAIISFALLSAGQALAQVPTPVTDTDFSKETENPITRQITLPLRYQADFLDGTDRLTKSTLEMDQAVVPFRLNDDWSLITRTKLPVEALPPKKASDSWADGLSNGYTTFFLSPEHGRGTVHNLQSNPNRLGQYVTQGMAFGPLGLEHLDTDAEPRPQNYQTRCLAEQFYLPSRSTTTSASQTSAG